MQEWDIECWKRKFTETTGYWKTDNGIEQLYIQFIEEGPSFRVTRPNEYESYLSGISPTYKYIPSGYYFNRYYGKPLLAYRKDTKAFKVGLSVSGFVMAGSPSNYNLEPLKIDSKIVLDIGTGALSRKYYMDGYYLYLLGKKVAKVKNKKILTYTNALDQEIMDLFKDTECQLM